MKFGRAGWVVAGIFFWACSKEPAVPVQTPIARDVEVLTLRPQPVQAIFEAVGTVRAKTTSALSSKILGTITSVPVREGDRVKQGQLLIAIDDRDLRAELQGARSAVEEAQSAMGAARSAVAAAHGQSELAAATFQRYEALIARGSVTAQEFDEVSTRHKVAQAELQRAEGNLRAAEARKRFSEASLSRAQTQLGYTQIAAPYDGVVTAKNAEVGALASPGLPLMTVEQAGVYRLEAQVADSLLRAVKVGAAAPVVIDTIAGALAGKVSEIVPAADPQSRTFTVKIDLPGTASTASMLRSGLYGKARFARGEKQALLVPTSALIEKGQLVGVFAVNDKSIAELRLVTVGAQYDGNVEVLSGLSAGDRIVTRGMEKLADGTRVAGAPLTSVK